MTLFKVPFEMPLRWDVLRLNAFRIDLLRREPAPATLLLLGLLPWFWTAFGLYWLNDYRLAMGLYECFGCLLPVIIWGRLSEQSFASQTLKGKSFAGRVLLGIVVLNALILVGWQWLAPHGLDWLHIREHWGRIHLADKSSFSLMANYFLIANPLVEELFWRGCVYTHCKRYYGVVWGLVLSSLFFGAWHWVVIHPYFVAPWDWLIPVLIAFGGLLFALVYELTGSLWPAVLLHGLGADLPIVCILAGIL